MNLQDITIHHFSHLLGKTLLIQFNDEVSLQAELIEVTELNGYSPLPRKPFSLIFRTGQKNEYYTQGIYVVNHPELQQIEMFLCPKGPDESGMKYEAIFS